MTTPATAAAAVRTHTFRIGGLRAHVVDDGTLHLPANSVAATTPPADLDAAVSALGLDPAAPLALGDNVLAVETRDGVLLVDGGFGGALPGTGGLRAGLDALGIAPTDVALVVVTHAHADHIAGLVGPDGRPAFPRARHVLSTQERAFWAGDPTLAELTGPPELVESLRRTAAAVLPALADVLETADLGAEVAPGVRLVPAVGHTPGHAAVEIVDAGERLLHLGDLLTHPELQLPRTDWIGPFETWPLHAVPARRRLLDDAASDGALVLASHFAFPGLGRVRTDGAAWTWHPVGDG